LRVKVRPFRVEELEQLTNFWKELQSSPAAEGTFALINDENVSRWQEYMMRVHKEDENQVLVAEADGELAGYVLFLKREEFPLVTSSSWAIINELHVALAYRRRGIGTKLMKEAFKYLKSKSITHVRINVMAGNHPAINLYRKLGFQDHSLKMKTNL